MQFLNIDVTLIDKTGLIPGKPKPDGRVPKYVDLTLHDNKAGRDQYGNDGFVTQSLPKERRQAGEKGPILGNWKHYEQRAAGPAPATAKPATPKTPEDDEIPF
jgi:hypothetical protein